MSKECVQCPVGRQTRSCADNNVQCALLGMGQAEGDMCMRGYLEDQKDDGEGGTKASDAEVGPGITAHG